jgi:G3E family GTPase
MASGGYASGAPGTEEDANPVASRTPVTVLSGALGAGKTTLLRYILEKPHGFRVAVIQNEFSEEMGIESPLIVDEKGETFKDIVELPNGCLCCSAKDGLIVALDRLLEDKRRFDYVIVEATGVADPESICEIFWVDDGMGCRVYLDGVVTLVDAHNALSALDGEGSGEGGDAGGLGLEKETMKQVACADVVVLNKADLAPEAKRKVIAERIRNMNPAAKILESTHAAVPLESILKVHAFDKCTVAAMFSGLDHGNAHGDGHESAHGHGHGPDPDCDESPEPSIVGHGHHGHVQSERSSSRVSAHRGIEGILVKGLDSPSTLYDSDKVQSWMADVLWESSAGGVYRCKGLFLGPRAEDDPMDSEGSTAEAAMNEGPVAYALQGVGKLFEIEAAPQVKEVPRSKFLFIGRDMKQEVLEKGLAGCLVSS